MFFLQATHQALSVPTFTGNVINNGTFKTTSTTATFAGTFTNNGVFTSDPATQSFVHLTISSSGALIGGTGDVFNITGDLRNESAQAALFDLRLAQISVFNPGPHDLEWSGADLGTTWNGYTNNFAIGTLRLGLGGTFNLLDGNNTPGAAIYVGALLLDGGLAAIANIHGNGVNIYYDPLNSANTYLNGGTYRLHAAEPAADGLKLSATDWPWWRGQTRDGVGVANQKPPLKWSATQNVLWKASVPGRGHASPTVVGQRVFLATADEVQQVQAVLCYDRNNGQQLWRVDVHTGELEKKGHQKSSQASSTVACDGERLFVNFLHGGAIFTTALDLDGKQLWQTRVSDFVTHQGFGSSPAIYRSLVIVSTDHKGGGVVAALDRATGKTVWQQERPKLPNYMSPAILKVAGRDQLLIGGCDLIASFNPLTGDRLWQTEGSTTECVGSIVTDGQLVFVSGGYPKKLTVAVKADGSGEVAWQNSVQTYVPSMLVHGGHLYTVTDSGVATCWKSATGEEMWKARLRGTFTMNDLQKSAILPRRPKS